MEHFLWHLYRQRNTSTHSNTSQNPCRFSQVHRRLAANQILQIFTRRKFRNSGSCSSHFPLSYTDESTDAELDDELKVRTDSIYCQFFSNKNFSSKLTGSFSVLAADSADVALQLMTDFWGTGYTDISEMNLYLLPSLSNPFIRHHRCHTQEIRSVSFSWTPLDLRSFPRSRSRSQALCWTGRIQHSSSSIARKTSIQWLVLSIPSPHQRRMWHRRSLLRCWSLRLLFASSTTKIRIQVSPISKSSVVWHVTNIGWIGSFRFHCHGHHNSDWHCRYPGYISFNSIITQTISSIHHLNGRNENTHGVKKRSCSLTTYYLIIHVASTQSPVLHPLASSRDLRRAALIKKWWASWILSMMSRPLFDTDWRGKFPRRGVRMFLSIITN